MKKVTIFVFLFCLPLLSIAQIDNNNAQETDVFQYEPENKNSMEYVPEDAESRDITAETVTVFGTIKEIAEKFPTHSVVPEKRRRSLSDFNQREKDVLVSQYWNGQDVSVKKFQTSLELGKLETSSKSIKIICRDHSYVDGDRVKLYVNEEVVRRSITLRAGYYTINVNLKEGFNRIDIEALNQGSSGPNTAEFKVLDENGILLADKEWNILTGYIATLVVMRN